MTTKVIDHSLRWTHHMSIDEASFVKLLGLIFLVALIDIQDSDQSLQLTHPQEYC